ncbi:hypothetical protein AcW1_002457 [Taiwanofungus camphoratus]|nr:hypothetical protein AcW1_002457 [Antrodia cinnamomea]
MNTIIPQWLRDRFAAISSVDAVHYESSLYGPINMLLTEYFPARGRFLVKPQPRLREPLVPGGRASTDSYGQSVGTSDDDNIPDFVVAVGGSQLNSDTLFLVLEVKRDGSKPGATAVQIERYTKWVRDNQQGMLPFAGVNDQTSAVILACGVKCTILKLYASGICNMSFVDITSDGMHIVLNDLRIAYGHFDDV